MPQHPKRRRGFTLIEGVVAVVLLGTALPPMMWALRTAQVRRVSSALASRARWLATEKLEDVIADRHSTTRGYAWLTGANYAAEAPVAGFVQFSRSVVFAETAADLVSVGTGYKKATVTVSWTDSTGTARSIAIATIVTDYTP
jgi:prepilin-type N-terminal cleavage/methylation domain-containing protein